MNNMHSNGEQDRSLNETLDKLGRSYAQLDRDEPPELLDMAIRNSAQRAVEKKPQRLKFGWLHGLTTAAVFVLALSLIVHQRDNQPAEDITIPFDKLERSPQAERAKKQSAEDRSRQSLQASKESADERQDQPAPVAAASAVAPREQTPGEALHEYGSSAPDKPGQQSAAVMADGDQFIQTTTIEETINEEKLDTAASTPGDLSARSKPLNEMQESAVAGAPQTLEPEARSNADTQAEEQLRAIIRMQQAGDERWKAELESFIKSHPDYPLPDELKN